MFSGMIKIIGEPLLIVVATVPLLFEIAIFSSDVVDLFGKHGVRVFAYTIGIFVQFIASIGLFVYRVQAWKKEMAKEQQLNSIQEAVDGIATGVRIIIHSTPADPAPTAAVPAPTPAVPAPTPAVPAPTAVVPAPTAAVPSPTPAVPAPTAVVPDPTAAVPPPTPAVPAPTAVVPAPTAAVSATYG